MGSTMIKVDGLSKEYRLGVIGQTTLRDAVARLGARLAHKEDPTLKIGRERTTQKGKFKALSDVSFEVRKGEALGIIGHNGAGKSTLLKLINQITLPTSGKIYLNGRVASMIEVGTGFHPELTGRENIYVNGAILGMSKKEIDGKLEEIIDFSECRRFIDTPVKRYSSGMYLKLGFSVAAHLDADIIIMDEVLAVGDAAFQDKCIHKMKELSGAGRTVLYVSHNMNTIRSLCDRCIVLNQGKLVFDGDVESAIQRYLSQGFYKGAARDLKDLRRPYATKQMARMESIAITNGNVLLRGESLQFVLRWMAERSFDRMRLRVGTWSVDGSAIAVSFADFPSAEEGVHESRVCVDVSHLAPGRYCLEVLLLEMDMGEMEKQDVLKDAISFEIVMSNESQIFCFYHKDWGHFELPMTVE